MNRKTIIVCIAAIAVLLAGVAVAVFFLYSGVDDGREAPDAGNPEYGCYQVVPSDAAAVIHFDRFDAFLEAFGKPQASFGIFPEGKFSGFLHEAFRSGCLKSSDITLSFHYVGGLEPLLAIDAGKSGASDSDEAGSLAELAGKSGLFVSLEDCGSIAPEGTYIASRKILLVSTSDVLVNSSERHIMNGISVLEDAGFVRAAETVRGSAGNILISNTSSGRIVEELFTSAYRRYSDFFRRFADWTAFSVDMMSGDHFSISGTGISGQGPDKFLNVFRNTSGGEPAVAEVLPSYTVSFFSVPVRNVAGYIQAYKDFASVRLGHSRYDSRLKELSARTGISPQEWAENMEIREVAVASFYVGSSLESLLLVRTGGKGLPDTAGADGEKTGMQITEYRYKDFASALFGSLFSVEDESHCLYLGDWLVAGSRNALEEYASGRALDYTLSSYLADAGKDRKSAGECHFIGYFSFTEDQRVLERVLRPEYAAVAESSYEGTAYAPAVFRIMTEKGSERLYADIFRISDVRTKAPEFERDTVVVIPKGPFKVKNSGTGKMNTFYQNDNHYLCLNDENGKGLWGAEFSTPICGRATTVDYFRNGKLQIIFASGSKLHLLDRLGRKVSPFPVELGKDVLLGPDVYDFNGRRQYNVMILHKDNTVEMYNLQGKKPASWKGITSDQTIRNLPEPLKVNGRTWWVVRTSIQTLIFPFYGGDPLTVFEGDRMIRPDSEVIPVKGGVEVTRYDGRKVTIEIE